MCELLIFGGTTEGRLLAEYCHENGIRAFVSVISGYGAQLLPKSELIQVAAGRMTAEEMASFMKEKGILTVLDATHPYAFEATGNIREACGSLGVKYYRVVREASGLPEEWGRKDEGRTEGLEPEGLDLEGQKPEGVEPEGLEPKGLDPEGVELEGVEPKGLEPEGVEPVALGNLPFQLVSSMEEAVCFLEGTKGRILVTTGSSKLHAFLPLSEFAARIYARVLPTQEAIAACEEMGLSGSHVIAMQGPFSEEMNRATMRQLKISYLVTKETGGAGGFLEKLSAARGLPVTTVVIGRPARERGISVAQATHILALLGGEQKGKDLSFPTDGHFSQGTAASQEKRMITLIGAGMGGPGQLTAAASMALKGCDVVFGAERFMETAKREAPAARWIPEYESGKIFSWLEAHPDFRESGVLYSGDTGFYSGAKSIALEALKEPYRNQLKVRMLPGISSVSYLCARVNRSWEQVTLLSLHGRSCSVTEALLNHPEVFVLLGGKNTVGVLCQELMENGFQGVQIIVGERLSYPDEKVTSGFPSQLRLMEFNGLAAALILRDGAAQA